MPDTHQQPHTSAADSPLRFVVLHHTGWPGRPDHYDLMLEKSAGSDPNEAALLTWATVADRFPGDHAAGSELLEMPDHRRAYLNDEGVISGGRGCVKRIDEGSLHWLKDPADNNVHEPQFMLMGRRLRGNFRIEGSGCRFFLKCMN